ncbi:MAG: NAD-dependent epimerase/dehydratase family protein, partial [Actinobacteria bacterium]|nr:NAD-dependent epimerase/dehydratase family protein [Actinomycetota bacterium]
VQYLIEDVRDIEAVETALDGVSGIVHSASMVGLGVDLADLPDYVSNNDTGTATLLEAMRRRGFEGQLVLSSSMVVYGEGRYRCAEHGVVSPGPRRQEDLASGSFEVGCPVCRQVLAPEEVPEDAPIDPRNVYAATKLHQEHLCAAWARETGLPVYAMRYHNVYGPRMPQNTPYAGVASIFRSALEAGVAPRVFEDGGQMRDFVHVRDVAAATVAPLLGEVPAGAYNVASGEPHTVGEMAAALASAIDGSVAPEVTGEFRLGDVRHVFASVRRAREVGITASVPFAQGMKEFAKAPLRYAVG